MTHQLPDDLDFRCLPHHVAVIMDGNGRWAERRGLPRIMGHRRGAEALKNLLRCCKDWGIQVLTAYAFSTENWRRPLEEVNFLMGLFERLLRKELAEMQQEGVRIQFLGNLAELPLSLQQTIAWATTETAHNQAVTLNVAVNYGSRDEIARACQALAAQVERGELSATAIDETLISRTLYTRDCPDPDLLIRTSGEQRLSNYLLWQLAYAEMVFTEVHWPDFDRQVFHQVLRQYQSRDRRFGQISQAPALIA